MEESGSLLMLTVAKQPTLTQRIGQFVTVKEGKTFDIFGIYVEITAPKCPLGGG